MEHIYSRKSNSELLGFVFYGGWGGREGRESEWKVGRGRRKRGEREKARKQVRREGEKMRENCLRSLH